MVESALVAAPIRAGEPLAASDWKEIRERAIFEFCKWDVQCEDHSVLAMFPLLMEAKTAQLLNEKAEALTREAFAAEDEILSRPELLDVLGLPRAIRRELQRRKPRNSGRREVRVMRFDFHLTTEGWRISEVNADVPGGFIEASSWNQLFAGKQSDASAPPDTSQIYARAIRKITRNDDLLALVHATAYSDDRQVMMHLARRFADQGLRTRLCSPSNLTWRGGKAEFCTRFAAGHPGVIVRFFPAEWLPNLGKGERWKPYFSDGETPMSNPGTAIVLQTKRFPLVWDELDMEFFAWRELLPETRDLREAGKLHDQNFVLKPALGRVGEGVGIRGVTPEAEFKELWQKAHSQREQWIAQERFEVSPVETDDGPRYPCIGVFTIGGEASGFYGRVSRSPIINRDAQDVAVLISD